MKPTLQECTAFILDTYKIVSSGRYLPGAIVFKGRKKIDIFHWEEAFPTEEEANAFVRDHFRKVGLNEVVNEGELPRAR